MPLHINPPQFIIKKNRGIPMIEKSGDCHSLFLSTRQNISPILNSMESITLNDMFEVYHPHNFQQIILTDLFIYHIGTSIGVNYLVPQITYKKKQYKNSFSKHENKPTTHLPITMYGL